MGAVITLTTDFGLADGYVAAMKGVVLGINPEARLVDISHNIRPQDIAQAAYVLSTAYKFFPRRTVHLVVVDPGVGSARRAVMLRTPEADFVAPDNGVLSYVVQAYAAGEPVDDYQAVKGAEAFAITEPRFWRAPVSTTFHGRDIFAPVAAHLSLGVSPASFGEAMDALKVLPLPRPHRAADGALVGHIRHIDGFGNLITSISRADLPAAETVTIEVGGRTVSGLSRTYSAGEGLLALIGSSDYLEISLKDGDAAAFLGTKVGDEVRVKEDTR